jgi:hypothetical protein
MSTTQWMCSTKLFPAGTLERAGKPCKRNLGGAIVLAAIRDYRSRKPKVHADARDFLYPRTAARRSHFAWVMTLAPSVDPGWLREALDRRRGKWDQQRLRVQSRRGKP